jgi:hypothetical protein
MYDNNKSYKQNLEAMLDHYRMLQEESEKTSAAIRYQGMQNWKSAVKQLNKFAEVSDDTEKGHLFRECIMYVNQMMQELKQVLSVSIGR